MNAKLIKKELFGKRDILYSFEIEKPQVVIPGQFVELEVNKATVPFLRRAISIFDAKGNIIELFIRTVGDGTKEISSWEIGHETDILFPLGNGFVWSEEANSFLLVGGGIGVAPLHFLARELAKAKKQVSIMFMPKRDEVLLEAFKDLNSGIEFIKVENRKELPEALEDAIKGGKGTDGIYVCGPTAMMKTVTEIASKRNIDVYVSLEENMGCGYGICAGCVVAIKTENGFEYKKTCVDGPIFLGQEVIFNE